MVASAKDVYSQFSKSELMEISSELGLEGISPATRSSEIVKFIYSDIESEGVPATDSDNCSDLLFQFLVTAEYIDEDGNLVDEGKEDSISEEDLPACFSCADEQDPACKKCSVFVQCMKKRLESRPPCFGKSFKETDEQCKVCLEALPCSLLVIKMKKGSV